MLKYRLLFGVLMILIFVGIILLDARIDGFLSKTAFGHRMPGTLFMILICLLAIPAQLEMSGFIRKTGGRLFTPIAIIGSMVLASAFYWPYFSSHPDHFFLCYLLISISLILMALFFVQVFTQGTAGTIRNCSATFFSIFYLGFFSSFVLGIRIEQGPWVLLFYILVIKCSDIGAYTIGRLAGSHKMAPSISPGKTWEGLAGAIGGGAIAAYGLSAVSGIMSPLQAVVFGAVFAVPGQLSDLAESLLKRDAELKDASGTVPGFGGVLDVIDSLLIPAPIAYAVFLWMLNQ